MSHVEKEFNRPNTLFLKSWFGDSTPASLAIS